jgi:hypothetical protein
MTFHHSAQSWRDSGAHTLGLRTDREEPCKGSITRSDVRRSRWIATGFLANQLAMNRRIFTALLTLLLSPTLFPETPPAAPAVTAAARQRVILKDMGPSKIMAIKVTRAYSGASTQRKP